MKKPKMFIPSSRRLRGAPAVSAAGEKVLPSLFYKYTDSFINYTIFRGLVRWHTTTKRRQHAETPHVPSTLVM
jgi:hypothetical protein